LKNILQPKSKEEYDTINSFNYQWTHLSDSKYLLTDESWRKNVDQYILDELSITKEDIKNKTVIDVGCGGGRWSYGFAKLGCKVTSVDISEGPCKLTEKNVPQAEVLMSDLFKLADTLNNRKFDIVWCWGVIHHTSNPHMAFETLTHLMHQNSIIHLYVYSFNRGKKVKTLRKVLRNFSLKNRERIIELLIRTGILHGSVHELYDTLSTQINHEINESSLKQWFEDKNLLYNRYTPEWAKESRDLFVTGSKLPWEKQ
jgi:2-polyprenyl-3-methyl-5-hydroxy-6-metoxy-1,4-benzoquinol methylase